MSTSTSTDSNIPDKASSQLEEFKQAHRIPERLTTSNGAPISNKSTVLTAGPRGPLLMQDVVYIDEIAHFDRERIPERVVHAKGGGAHGYFEVTHDITKYSKADLFSEVGKRTPLFIRFSTVGGESGSADTVRDPRGFAIKFYTEEGNWDLVGFIHTQKRNPRTHLKDPNMMWDFWTLRPESLHQVMFLFSDRGTPDGFRHMNGYGSHTFKLVNKDGQAVYCKFHLKPLQGIKNLPADKAARLTGENPDYAIRDLYNAIESGHFPEWNFFIQVMTFEQASQHKWNPFDVTKVWPHKDHPLIPVGKVILNRNPSNYFAEVEQAAFSPAHIVPGIDFSPDKMLQGRLLSYTDTHYHRLGTNYIQLPINCPYRARVHNYQRDGLMALGDNQNGTPVYHPNTNNGPAEPTNAAEQKHLQEHQWELTSNVVVARHDAYTEANYDQPTMFWEKVLDEGGKRRLVENIVEAVRHVVPAIQKRVVEEFSKVHKDLGEKIAAGLEEAKRNKPHL